MREDFASVNTRITQPSTSEGSERTSEVISAMKTLLVHDNVANAADFDAAGFTATESNDVDLIDTMIDRSKNHSSIRNRQARHSSSDTSGPWRGELLLRDKVEDGFKDWVSHIAFSPDGKTLVAGSDDEISLWNTDSPIKKKTELLVRGKSAHKIAFSPDGKYLASGFHNDRFSSGNSIYVWGLCTQKSPVHGIRFPVSIAYGTFMLFPRQHPPCKWRLHGQCPCLAHQ
jgi:WD40 repeat protein